MADRRGSAAEGQTIDEAVREADATHLLLNDADLVADTPDLQSAGLGVIDPTAGGWIAVAGLANGSGVDYVAQSGLQENLASGEEGDLLDPGRLE